MEWNYIAEGIDALVIDNFYSKEQLADINKELQWLTKPSIMGDQSTLSPATVLGVVQTSKSGIFLEEVMVNWKHSSLISSLITNMAEKDFQEKMFSYNSLYKMIYGCNYRTHLLSYYENADYYKPHTDAAVFTILSYFNKEPKKFTGGEIVLSSAFGDKNATIEVNNNRVIIIASCTSHSVNPIISDMSNSLSGDGRYCCATFLSALDERQFKKKD